MTDDLGLRTTFDSIASRYRQARPDYPAELFDDLIALTGVEPSDHLLEVGCGPGIATLPLARKGYPITAIELGQGLADEARRALSGFPHVSVVTSSFEGWEPTAEPDPYALIYAATAWHWVDAGVKYAKAAKLLRPGGFLAVWGAGHAFPVDYDPFFKEIQATYKEIAEDRPGEWPPRLPENEPGRSEEFEASGHFSVVGERRYLWAIRYTTEEYIALLNTFSGHIAMEPAKREHLYAAIRRMLANRPDRTLTRHWSCVLTVGRLVS